MSLGIPIGRPLVDQARSVVAFLSHVSHVLSEDDAQRLCAALPEDPKLAAKSLRLELARLGINIKHTHALKAVAELRGASGYMGLAGQPKWDVAAWIDDAPAVSANRRLHDNLSKAADDLCRRIRDQFEPGDEPFIELIALDNSVELLALDGSGAGWRALLVATNATGQSAAFPLQEQQRLGERLRRLVEGELGGWLDGLAALSLPKLPGQAAQWSESNVIIEWASTEDLSDQLPIESPVDSLSTPLGQSPEGWSLLRRRHLAFAQRHDVSFREWVDLHTARSDRFAPEPFNVGVVETARVRLEMSHLDLAQAISIDLSSWERARTEGNLPIRKFPRLAQVLKLTSPNDLLDSPRTSPQIPLPTHKDMAFWLSHLEAEVIVYDDGVTIPEELRSRLSAICALPHSKRGGWDKQAPATLKELNKEIRFAGFVVCASMTKRFVQDLPLGRARLALMSVLSLETEERVRTQDGQLSASSMSLPAEGQDDPITPEWLTRFNTARFSGQDLMKYSEQVEEMRDPDADDDDKYQVTMFAAVKVFGKQPGKAHAATVRMEAVSRLIQEQSLEPWVLKSAEDDASMLSRPVFEAAARCELIDVRGRAGFDPKAFYMCCVEHARREASPS